MEKHRHFITDWAENVGEKDWNVYTAVLQAAESLRIPFALGGAFALASYIGGYRNTKDIDLYVLPRTRKAMINLVTNLGMSDYYEQKPYDRRWIYRATTDGVIVDVIWAMANHRVQVDNWWMSGPEVELRGRRIRVLPPEVLLWDKLYVFQRERCDWPDAMNLLYFLNGHLDWKVLLERIDDDGELLAGALSVFRWLAPGLAQRIPEWVWETVRLPLCPEEPLPKSNSRHAALLDQRPWFGPDRRKQLPG